MISEQATEVQEHSYTKEYSPKDTLNQADDITESISNNLSNEILINLLSQYAYCCRSHVEFTTKSGNIFQAILTSCTREGFLQMKKVEVVRGVESLKTRIIDQILVRVDKIEKIKLLSADFISPDKSSSGYFNQRRSYQQSPRKSTNEMKSTPSSFYSNRTSDSSFASSHSYDFHSKSVHSPSGGFCTSFLPKFTTVNDLKQTDANALEKELSESVKADIIEFIKHKEIETTKSQKFNKTY